MIRALLTTIGILMILAALGAGGGLFVFFKFGQGKKYPKPDVIFIDPPRAGMHKFMTNYLPKFEAKKIIYISCNPSTQARDTEILQNKGYSLKNLTVVDMFPHTPHIESVGVFQRN